MREHILTPKSIFSYASVSQKIGVFGQTLIKKEDSIYDPPRYSFMLFLVRIQ